MAFSYTGLHSNSFYVHRGAVDSSARKVEADWQLPSDAHLRCVRQPPHSAVTLFRRRSIVPRTFFGCRRRAHALNDVDLLQGVRISAG